MARASATLALDFDLTGGAARAENRARADRTSGKTALTTSEREELARLRHRESDSVPPRGGEGPPVAQPIVPMLAGHA
jgi:hypothetical protein